jgi:Tfp pilus assembly protein PilN
MFTIENLTLEEIQVIRQSLNVIEIKGSSAQFIANLQIKLDGEIAQIKEMLLEQQFLQQTSQQVEESPKPKTSRKA